FSADDRISPASSNADQNRGTSESDSTRSRLRVSLSSIPAHGLAVTTSCLTAHVKMALAAALTWLATTGAWTRPTTARTSLRVIDLASSLLHRGRRCLRTRASACRQDLFFRLAYCST